MEEDHKEPKVVPTVDPRYCTKTLENMEEYIRGFRGVYGKPLSYGLSEDLTAPVSAHDPMYRANVSE